jgi:hypothetical protein
VANTLGWGTRMGAEQSVARAAGATWLREELQWKDVAPRRGERHWRRFDRLFAAAAHRGIHILPLLNEPPSWAGARRGALPTDAQAYGAFVADVVARYGPSGSFWRAHPGLDDRVAPVWFELWNEPYFARPGHSLLTARRYAALAAAGIRAGRAADPRARFLVAVDPANAAPGGQADARWLAHLVAAQPGLLASADGVALHPYAADGAASLRVVDRLRASLAAQRSDAPIWVTEVGWSTCARGGGCVTERRQAEDLTRFLGGARERQGLDAVFVYHLASWRVRSGDQLFGDFGLLRRNTSRKPAYTVFRRFARGLAATAGT